MDCAERLMDRALPRPIDLSPEILRAARFALMVAGAAAMAWTLWRIYNDPWGGDAYAYWLAWRNDDMYGELGGAHAYLYSPVFAQVIYPLTLLPWVAFYVLWVGLSAAAVVLFLGPVWGGLAFALFYPAWQDAWVGNIHNLMALAIVVGFRYPAAWSFLLLTKVTPGVGLIWFAVRREWRSLGIALGVTVGIVSVSALIAPNLWVEWIALLASSEPDPSAKFDVPLTIRLPLAAALVAIGAWKGWRWLVPLAVLVSLPAIWVSSLALLLAIPRLAAHLRHR
jgi:hypothetical protein